MANYTTTITNEGAALLASVIANQGTLTFNEFRFSENDYTGQESTLTEGTFLGVFITASAAASVIDSTTIKASAQFNNSTITGNHNLYSIGIIGTDGNTTALIAVCTTTDPDVIREPLTGTSTYAFNVNLTVSDTSQITVVGTTAAVLYDIDVIDNLTSTATNKPLSANQGRVLKGNIDDNFSGQSNENFIDNPFFTVNQRGFSSQSITTKAYTVDRWYGQSDSSATFSISSSGLSIAAGSNDALLMQIIEDYSKLNGEVVTASVMLSDGTIKSGTVTLNTGTSTDLLTETGFKVCYASGVHGISIVSFAGNTTVVKAVKLELGTVSTLANDVEPNYTTERLKCRRYFKRIFSGDLGLGIAVTTTLFDLFVANDVTMRNDSPTVVSSGTISLLDTAGTITGVTLVEGATNTSLKIRLTSSSNMTTGTVSRVQLAGYIDIIDDL